MPDLLTEALEREARTLDVPPAPTVALCARGRGVVRRRHRNAGLTVLALALVAGAALVLLRPDPASTDVAGRPNSVADLPVGVRPKVPYVDGLDLVTTDQKRRRQFNHPPVLLGPDVVVISGSTGPGIAYSRFDGTGYGALNGKRNTYLTPWSVVSADGHWAAATYFPSPSSAAVQVFDLRKEVRARIVTFDSAEDNFQLTGIDDDGAVYAEQSPGTGSPKADWRSDPDTGETTTLNGIDGSVVSVRGDGRLVVAVRTGITWRATIGRLDRSHTFRPEATVTGAQALWSPDDALVASISSDKATVRVGAGSRERLLGVPSMVTVRGMVWEDEDDLLVWVVDTGSRGSLLRCHAGDGRCELALAPFGPDAALPVRN